MNAIFISPARKVPQHFAVTAITITQLPAKHRLALVRREVEAVKTGDHKKVAEIVKVVVGSDFDPAVVTAARKAMEPITSIKYDRHHPLEQFGLTNRTKMNWSYSLGAFFECLPRKLGTDIYRELYLYNGYWPYRVRVGGQALLGFSCVQSAADFLLALFEKAPDLTLLRLHQTGTCKVVRTYEFRRYDASALAAAFNALRPA